MEKNLIELAFLFPDHVAEREWQDAETGASGLCFKPLSKAGKLALEAVRNGEQPKAAMENAMATC